ncbi:hypothetical protein OGAPHI_003530 [Ogataea philodendri]|uniref:Protein SIP5 n=1 Tax=Ogataea philodendri TaxID=1378263 RepID=A0A9P8P656_9ASCO|nr:uncharacterized protein OGAPHI_003530 [Ogataea philodendri]KAH3666533.1 hypothetical protein OGAPHI_003530 [Ogataea philodendri]
MGNAPAKETRSASSSFSKDNLSTSRSLVGLSKKKKEKDREKRRLKEEHMLDLIVRYQENVDGGFLAPYGNYKGGLNYKTSIVRELITNRRLSPFYTPLQDYDENWTDDELLKALRSLPLHAPVENIDPEEEEDPDDHKIHQSAGSIRRKEQKAFKRSLAETAVKLQLEAETRYNRDKSTSEMGIKTFPNIPSDDLLLALYRGAIECPICFLYYPTNLNLSRCCVQPICTECFVQLKRLDPHPPHDEGDTPNVTDNQETSSEELISEPVNCPFCAMADFGVTYHAPNIWTGIGGRPPRDFQFSTPVIQEDPGFPDTHPISDSARRTSLSYVMTKSHSASGTSPKKSTILSDASGVVPNSDDSTSFNVNRSEPDSNPKNYLSAAPARQRRGSLPATAPGVITVDFIRPDWEQRLLNAKSKLAKRSAAATALHASSLIYERRRPSSEPLERYDGGSQRRSSLLNRNSHSDHLHIEERMIEEALRLSLLDEEERKLKERLKKHGANA